MKPAPFAYVAPRSLDEAIEALRQSGGEAKLLAGGQSLIPLLNFRLATPTCLVDLNRVKELEYVAERHGGIAIGAMARDQTVERDPRIARATPLLVEAVGCVGHPAIRSRGTVGGSLAHADPTAELPAVAVCLDARVTVAGPRGVRQMPAERFFTGYLSTVLEPDEVLTEVWVPSVRPGTGQAWLEFARRHGDFALVGVGVSLSVDGDIVRQARIALAGVGGTPFRAREAEILLIGGTPAERASAAADAVRSAIDPEADIHASKAYRVQLAGVLTERAIRLAYQRALEAGPGHPSGPRGALGNPPAALDVRRAIDEMGRRA